MRGLSVLCASSFFRRPPLVSWGSMVLSLVAALGLTTQKTSNLLNHLHHPQSNSQPRAPPQLGLTGTHPVLPLLLWFPGLLQYSCWLLLLECWLSGVSLRPPVVSQQISSQPCWRVWSVIMMYLLGWVCCHLLLIVSIPLEEGERGGRWPPLLTNKLWMALGPLRGPSPVGAFLVNTGHCHLIISGRPCPHVWKKVTSGGPFALLQHLTS